MKCVIIYTAAGIQGLARSEQAGRVPDGGSSGGGAGGAEGELQFRSHLTLMAQVLFLAGLNSINTLEKNIRRCRGESSFPLRRWHRSTGPHAEQLLEARCTILHLGLVHQTNSPPQMKKGPLPVPAL